MDRKKWRRRWYDNWMFVSSVIIVAVAAVWMIASILQDTEGNSDKIERIEIRQKDHTEKIIREYKKEAKETREYVDEKTEEQIEKIPEVIAPVLQNATTTSSPEVTTTTVPPASAPVERTPPREPSVTPTANPEPTTTVVSPSQTTTTSCFDAGLLICPKPNKIL